MSAIISTSSTLEMILLFCRQRPSLSLSAACQRRECPNAMQEPRMTGKISSDIIYLVIMRKDVIQELLHWTPECRLLGLATYKWLTACCQPHYIGDPTCETSYPLSDS